MGGGSDGDVAGIIDSAQSLPPKSKSKSTENGKNPKASSSKSAPPVGSDRVQELKGIVNVRCVRKQWAKELADMSDNQQVSHLKSILVGLGMTGEPNKAKAERIKEARASAAELEDVQEFAVARGAAESTSNGRLQRSAAKPTRSYKLPTGPSAGSDEEDDEDGGEQPPRRKSRARRKSGETSEDPDAEHHSEERDDESNVQADESAEEAEHEMVAGLATVSQTIGDIVQVPEVLRDGLPMLKITKKKLKQSVFHFEADGSAICWQSRKVGRIAIDQIREIRFGPSAIPKLQLASTYSLAQSSHFITIVYTNTSLNWKSLNVIAPSQAIFRTWLDTIVSLVERYKSVTRSDGVIGILGSKGHGNSSDGIAPFIPHGNQAETLPLTEVIRICARMGIAENDSLHKAFAVVDEGRKGFLVRQELEEFMVILRRRTDIEGIYRYLTEEGPLTQDRFKRFMREVQISDMSDDAIQALFTTLSIRDPPDTPPSIPLESFQTFITSSSTLASAIQPRADSMDMNRSLSHYYISSSHNTYLLGNQWRGGSSVEGYVRALLAGCRSVEVDCWDGDPEPLVYHGKTLTTPVPLRHVCETISKYAFMASQYPLIISAEIHCTARSQLMLVQILKETFGAALVAGPLDGCEVGGELPSPEQLKGRILFKCKCPVQDMSKNVPPDPQAFTSSATESTESDFDRSSRSRRTSMSLMNRVTSKVSSLGIGTPTPPVSIKAQYSSSTLTADHIGRTEPRQSDSLDSFASSSMVSRQTSSTSNTLPRGPAIVDELAALLVYTAGVKFQGFTKLVLYEPRDMFSVSERTAGRLLRETPLDFVKHNRTHLTRTYPNGTRLTSSNYAPQKFWAAGSQLVALNMQTCDSGYQINCAFFSGCHRSGYRLKPDALQDKALQYQLLSGNLRLDLKVISGQSIAIPSGIDLDDARIFVEATIHLPGVRFSEELPGGTKELEGAWDVASGDRWRTKTVNGNTFNPIWNHEQPMSFRVEPGLLDICFLRIELRHQPNLGDDVPVAVHIANLGTLLQGYRQLPLFDKQMSQFLFSTLLIKVHLRVM